MGIVLQSAAIPYLVAENGIQVVLITNSKRSHWIYPKGVIEPDMTPWESAAQEALEEAGVAGEICDTELCVYWYEKWNSECRVSVFPLEVHSVMEHWDEKGLRDRKIVNVQEAIDIVQDDQRPGLELLVEYLDSRVTE